MTRGEAMKELFERIAQAECGDVECWAGGKCLRCKLLADCQSAITELQRQLEDAKGVRLQRLAVSEDLAIEVGMIELQKEALRSQLEKAEALLRAVEHHFETPYEKRVTSPGGIAGAVTAYFKEKP